MANDCKVFSGVSGTNGTSVFAKGDIEHPMDLIFHTPMAAHGLSKFSGSEDATQQIEAGVSRDDLTSAARAHATPQRGKDPYDQR